MSTMGQIEKDIQEIKVTSGIQGQRLDTLEHEMEQMHIENKAIYEIGSSVKILAEGMTAIKEDVKDVKEDVRSGLEDVRNGQSNLSSKLDSEVDHMKHDIDEIRTQPIKRKSDWLDKVVWTVIGGGLAFAVSAILDHFFG